MTSNRIVCAIQISSSLIRRPRPRRRWLRYSLRTLFVVTTIVAFGGGWIQYRMAGFVDQRRAGGALRAVGADLGKRVASPQWLWRWYKKYPLADCADVEQVNLYGRRQLRDEHLAALPRLTKIQVL